MTVTDELLPPGMCRDSLDRQVNFDETLGVLRSVSHVGILLYTVSSIAVHISASLVDLPKTPLSFFLLFIYTDNLHIWKCFIESIDEHVGSCIEEVAIILRLKRIPSGELLGDQM